MTFVRIALLTLAASLLLACNAVPVASGLDEGDANRILVALDRVSIDALKEADPSVEGKFRVTVERDDAARAIAAMRDEELPRPRAEGVLDAMDKSALVPSETAEHAQFVAGLAGDLERSLESVSGVLRARVHLNVPSPDPLRPAGAPKATASVLLEHRGSAPPLTVDAVQRLVAGGVPWLSSADVAVVMAPRPAPPIIAPASQLAHVGPIAVARASVRTLQLAFGGMLVVIILLAGWSASLYVRLSRRPPAPARRGSRAGDAELDSD